MIGEALTLSALQYRGRPGASLLNCSKKIECRSANELIKALGRLVYYCNAGLDTLELRGMDTTNIFCLWWATWSSGLEVPSNNLIDGNENLLDISIILIWSSKGESAKLFLLIRCTGAGTPEILVIKDSSSQMQASSSLEFLADGFKH